MTKAMLLKMLRQAIELLAQFIVGTHRYRNARWECTVCRRRAPEGFRAIEHEDWCPSEEANNLVMSFRRMDEPETVPRDVERDGGGGTWITNEPGTDIAAVIEHDAKLDALAETIRRT